MTFLRETVDKEQRHHDVKDRATSEYMWDTWRRLEIHGAQGFMGGIGLDILKAEMGFQLHQLWVVTSQLAMTVNGKRDYFIDTYKPFSWN